MLYFASKTAGIVIASIVAVACASVVPRAGQERLAMSARAAGVPIAPAGTLEDRAAVDARTRELLAVPLTSRAAVELGLLNNPKVHAEFARMGVSEADRVAAGRLSNPVLFASRTDGGASHISIFSLTQNLSDLLLLSAHKHLAAAEYQQVEDDAAAAIVNLAEDIEQAWVRYVSSEQVAAMRALIATSAETSSQLAERFFAAGNINELDLALAHSGAAQARIGATRAAADAVRSKFMLHQLLGLTGEPVWSAPLLLPAPAAAAEPLDTLLDLARSRRTDLAAARREAAIVGDALALARRWRWLGRVDVGIEHDREQDGTGLIGPSIALALPIFDLGQAGIARAEARLARARSWVSALEIEVDNGVRLGRARVEAARIITSQFVQYVNPAQQLVVERQQQRQNFMLIGQFELLLAKQQQYDGYQSYLEALRDYWLAYGDLERATGGALHGAATIALPAIGVDGLMPNMSPSGTGEHP